MGRKNEKIFSNKTKLVQKEDKVIDSDGNVVRKYEIKDDRIEDSDTSSMGSDPEQPQRDKKQKIKKTKNSEIDKIEKESDSESGKRTPSPSHSKKGKKGKKGFFSKIFGWFDQKKEIIRTTTRKYGARFARNSMKKESDEKISAAAIAVLAGR
ncbi:unnamed protein product [Chironomus riparius]|uniref:Uncharacterized protein n=1 Tax=Chironomus riparius TaxID=315576 RepID=A0A9N9WUM7_9DIPT|nr:unnamed protein product [Chironomus riparius]